VIDGTNNSLAYQKSGGTKTTITISSGNYNSGTLITAINLALSIAGNPDLTISINTINGKMQFASSAFSTYTIYNLANGSTMGKILGIGANISFSNSGYCDYPLNLLGKSKLLINSRNLNNVAYTSYGLGFTTTIATVPVNVPPYSLIQYTCRVEQQKNILVNRVLDNIDIQILDTDNQFINFNNVDWSITLVLSIEKMDANKFHVQNFNDYLGNEEQPIQPEEIELNPPDDLREGRTRFAPLSKVGDKELEFLQSRP
jgi:hypothetical protein